MTTYEVRELTARPGRDVVSTYDYSTDELRWTDEPATPAEAMWRQKLSMHARAVLAYVGHFGSEFNFSAAPGWVPIPTRFDETTALYQLDGMTIKVTAR